MIDWKKIRKRAKTAALLSIMTAGYLAPRLIWNATDRTLQLSPCSLEEAIASDHEDNEVIGCYHPQTLARWRMTKRMPPVVKYGPLTTILLTLFSKLISASNFRPKKD